MNYTFTMERKYATNWPVFPKFREIRDTWVDIDSIARKKLLDLIQGAATIKPFVI